MFTVPPATASCVHQSHTVGLTILILCPALTVFISKIKYTEVKVQPVLVLLTT